MRHNIVHIADPHIGTGYKTRSGNFVGDQYKKIKWVLNFCNKNNAALTIGGDVFDSSRVGQYELLGIYIRLFRKMDVPVIFIAGQHDLRYHRFDTYNQTPLRILELSCPNCFLAGEKPINVGGKQIYGTSWKEPIPTPVNRKAVNVLLIHKSIGKLFKTQQKVDSGESLINKDSKFNIVLTGDNHQTFVLNQKRKILINPGSMMRLKSDQIDHKPSLFLIRGITDKILQYEIPLPDIEFTQEESVDVLLSDDFIKEVKNTRLEKKDFITFIKTHAPEEIEDVITEIVRRLQ